MKKIDFTHLVVLFFLLMTWGVTHVKAADEKAAREMFQDIKELEKLNSDVREVGTLKSDCLSCIEKSVDQKISLDKETIDLGRPLFPADNKAYTIFLKRTSSSPAKIDLKLKNGHRYCEKTIITSFGGGLGVDCILYLYNYEDEELSLNLKNLPKLKEGEEEIIELKLIKPDINNAKYKVEVKNLSQSSARESVDKKFFGSGFNVSFDMKSK
jgi:hypothetical protein